MNIRFPCRRCVVRMDSVERKNKIRNKLQNSLLFFNLKCNHYLSRGVRGTVGVAWVLVLVRIIAPCSLGKTLHSRMISLHGKDTLLSYDLSPRETHFTLVSSLSTGKTLYSRIISLHPATQGCKWVLEICKGNASVNSSNAHPPGQ